MAAQDAPASWGGLPVVPVVVPVPVSNGNGHHPAEDGGYEWKRLSDIQVRKLEFIQKPFLQASAFHLLVGVKNAGKGTWLAHWAAQITRGDLGAKTNVMWVAIGEDSYAMDVRPRIDAAGGDSSKVTVLTKGQLLLPESLDEITRAAAEAGNVGLIVIDPLGGSLSGDKNTNRDTDIRPALAALNTAADTIGTMVIGVRHLSIKHERRQGGSLSAILGSSDWVNIPRAVLGLFHDDVDAADRHLFVITGNRVKDDTPGLMFRIEGHTPDGWEEEVTVARELGESSKDPDELLVFKRNRKATKTDAARNLILQTLAAQDGYHMNSDLLDAEIAKRTGLAAKTVRNTRGDLKNEGLIRAHPEKDEHGTVTQWMVGLTAAGVAETAGDETC